MKTGILIQTRMGSTRLPGKVMKPLCGIPVIEHIIKRLTRVNVDLPPIVSTTTNPGDDLLEDFCRKKGFLCFRGSEENLMNRTLKAAEHYNLDVFVRLGGDAPFVDYQIINHMLSLYRSAGQSGTAVDYVSNSLERSFPLGLDADIMSASLLRQLAEICDRLSPDERYLNEENVTPYLHQHLDTFSTLSYKKDFDYSGLRLTLDTPEDFELTRLIYEVLYPEKPDFVLNDILQVLKTHPDWAAINADMIPTTGYWTETEKNKLMKGLADGKLYGTIGSN